MIITPFFFMVHPTLSPVRSVKIEEKDMIFVNPFFYFVDPFFYCDPCWSRHE